MKNYRNIVIIFLCIFFSACEAEWVMDLEVNEDESGKYSISILLDQEAQIYAIETGQTEIGGLQSIIESLPCLLYTSPSPRDKRQSRMPSSA